MWQEESWFFRRIRSGETLDVYDQSKTDSQVLLSAGKNTTVRLISSYKSRAKREADGLSSGEAARPCNDLRALPLPQPLAWLVSAWLITTPMPLLPPLPPDHSSPSPLHYIQIGFQRWGGSGMHPNNMFAVPYLVWSWKSRLLLSQNAALVAARILLVT